MNNNILTRTDSYKLGHMEQYVPNTTKVYSYLCARKDVYYKKAVFFGLQYYLKQYLSKKITKKMGRELIRYRNMMLGSTSEDVKQKINALCNLGYWPIEIKAVPEGTVIENKNVLMTITNTHPDFYWCVGFIESMILKLWYPISVAITSYTYRDTVEKYFNETVDPEFHFLKDFTVHDFGYRGDSSEEGSGLSGAAHLLSFLGSDTVTALPFIEEYYQGKKQKNPIMLTVPASEHSVMCSYGKDDELGAFKRMLELYPTGLVSIVIDTYNVYYVLTTIAGLLKDQILTRDGKVVFRPDSGNPEYIICGDPNAAEGTPEYKGAIRLLDEMFGSTVNSKGYKVLNPKVGLIYGDGMYLERYQRTLERLKEMGYAASNLVIGVGGILRQHTRDTLGFALKATYVEVNGVPREIEKTPITDQKKKSHKGLLRLDRVSGAHGSVFVTRDQVTPEEEAGGILRPVFRDGKILIDECFETIRKRVR